MKVIKLFLFLSIPFFAASPANAQSFSKGDVIANVNIGTPHLYRNIVRLATRTEAFKSAFSGTLEVSSVTGLNPIAIKGELGINEYFGIGLSACSWNMKIDVKDYYNIQRAGQIIGTDEIDIYKFKITSSSIGIRPNFHFPFEKRNNDLYIGCAFGITKNRLQVDFTSTDINKVFPDLKYDFSLPGGFYIAPSLGYRHYFGEFIGFNLELGYEKGAILQGGIVARINVSKNKPADK